MFISLLPGSGETFAGVRVGGRAGTLRRRSGADGRGAHGQWLLSRKTGVGRYVDNFDDLFGKLYSSTTRLLPPFQNYCTRQRALPNATADAVRAKRHRRIRRKKYLYQRTRDMTDSDKSGGTAFCCAEVPEVMTMTKNYVVASKMVL
jgi:hypothetical protein